jgi:cobalt-zinc-cadmium resistance protein CzcA
VIGSELDREFPGVDWSVSLQAEEGLLPEWSAEPEEEVLKIIGPDLPELEHLAEAARQTLRGFPDITGVRERRLLGPIGLEFRVDPIRCARWGFSVAEVQAQLDLARDGRVTTEMVEGENRVALTLIWPPRFRGSEQAVLDIPVDIPDPLGKGAKPAIRLRDLAAPPGEDRLAAPPGVFQRFGALTIYRERGARLTMVKFRPPRREWANLKSQIEARLAPLLQAPYKLEWADR